MVAPEQEHGLWLHEHRRWCFAVFIVAALLGLALIFFVNVQFANDYARTQRDPGLVLKDTAVVVRIQLEFENSKRAFEGEAKAGLTLESALGEIATVSGLTLVKSGRSLTGINSVRNSAAKQWNVYVNDTLMREDPLGYSIKGGDRIVLRYE